MDTKRTADFYRHVLGWILATIEGRGTGFLLGVNGPQGSGKTTLTAALCEKLARLGKRAISVSVDDFYLTRAEQAKLAVSHPANPYFQQRGYPGTHDVELGARVLRALKSPRRAEVSVPRYDKSAHSGQGDRAPASAVAETPFDLIFLEGWMLGFGPVSAPPGEAMAEVNEALRGYHAWHELLDGFLQIVPLDYRYVLDWRVEAERKMRARGQAGMSDAEILAYVEKFLPAYETYLPALSRASPVDENVLRITVARDRLPSP